MKNQRKTPTQRVHKMIFQQELSPIHYYPQATGVGNQTNVVYRADVK
jgi:hypothetical protein